MPSFLFTQVDVFGVEPLRGNPVAVVHDADALSDAQMQAVARWTHLSETTFLLRPTQPDADYRVRIFTPGGELPFAGHPTLGSAHAWLEAGGVPAARDVVVQECGVGPVRLVRDASGLAFEAPPVRIEPVDPGVLAAVVAALGLTAGAVQDARWLDNGPRWLALRLGSAQQVLAVEPDHAALRRLVKVGLVGPHAAGHPSQFELRAFAAPIGVPEDPVTGSLNASVAQWLTGEGRAPDAYVASQGQRLGHDGRVRLRREGEAVWVGGATFSGVRGTLSL